MKRREGPPSFKMTCMSTRRTMVRSGFLYCYYRLYHYHYHYYFYFIIFFLLSLLLLLLLLIYLFFIIIIIIFSLIFFFLLLLPLLLFLLFFLFLFPLLLHHHPHPLIPAILRVSSPLNQDHRRYVCPEPLWFANSTEWLNAQKNY